VCYDFLGIESPFETDSIANVTISGYPSGHLPRISLSIGSKNITIINSTDIEILQSDSNNITFIDSYRIKIYRSDIETTKFVDSRDINIPKKSVVKNVVFSNSSNINYSGEQEINNCCILSSSYIDLVGGIYDCNIYECGCSKIESCVKSYINKSEFVNIKGVKYSNIRETGDGDGDNMKIISGDNISMCGNKLSNLLVLREGVIGYYSDNKMNKINIPTTASLVTDESSGKTIDVIIQELQDRITALEGA
jgi:hypothetical protein